MRLSLARVEVLLTFDGSRGTATGTAVLTVAPADCGQGSLGLLVLDLVLVQVLLHRGEVLLVVERSGRVSLSE